MRKAAKFMRNLLTVLFAILFLTFAANAQQDCKTRVEFSADGKRPIAITDLMDDYRDYTNRQYTGRIAQIKYDPDDGAAIVGFALELDNGIRESVDITHDDCVYSMSPLEISWLPYLIRKGYRVRVDAEISGSGGFINARNIVLLETPKKSGGKSSKSKKVTRKKP
jgi:hypothetical protein